LSPLYTSLQSVGEKVKHGADSEAQQTVADELADIERLWLDADSQLTEQLQQQESTARVLREVEAGMESILEQLKKMRTSLVHPLSDNCDDLEQELWQCQVCLSLYYSTFLNLICNQHTPRFVMIMIIVVHSLLTQIRCFEFLY